MKMTWVLVGILLLFLLTACSETGAIQGSASVLSVAGDYEGTMTFEQVETAEDDSWEGMEVDASFRIVQNGESIDLYAIEEGEERVATGKLVGNTATMESTETFEDGLEVAITLTFAGNDEATAMEGEIVYTMAGMQDVLTLDAQKVSE